MSEIKPHPLQVEAELFAAKRRAERASMKEAIAHATANGMRFIEIAPTNYTVKPAAPARAGRMTIAYAIDRRNVVGVATSLCHPDDQFDKLLGRYLALEHFINERIVTLHLPIRPGASIKDVLSQMFTHHTY
jgi:uncharacterized protein (UPF0276 family)